MKIANLLFTLLISVPTSAFAQAGFSLQGLEGLDAAQIKAMPLPEGLPAEKSWGVNYILKGVVSLTENGPYLNTADGRLFKLDLSDRKARRFDNKTVIVEAQAKQADDLALLKVGKISEYEPKAGEIVPAPYQPRRRTATMLENKDGRLVMGNVRMSSAEVPAAGSYEWTEMTIRPELIKNVYFIKKPFKPEIVAAHSFFVFTFEKGGLVDANGHEPMALALSIEGKTRVDQSFSPLTGLKRSFGINWSLSTWEEYAARTIHEEKGHLVPYPVLLDHAGKAALLRESMTQAAVDREGEFYHTIKNNCTNNLLILLNRVLPKDRQIKLWTIPYMVYNVKATMPLMVISNLQKKGILGAEFTDINAQTLHTRLP
ncbi:MAG: lipoprotein N-acyltransferase Lnb domain-containing protein [Elusimicrobiales bacterium]